MMRLIKLRMGMALFFICSILSTRGGAQSNTEAVQIRQEIEQMKQEYEQRLKKLEERLKQLEASTASPKVSESKIPAQKTAAEPNPQAASASSAQKASAPAEQGGRNEKPFNKTTESINQALSVEENNPLRKRAEHVLQEFVDITGYFRAGYGRNDAGGPQVGFQAPGAMAKGRLGNEAENYGELVVGKNFYLPGAFSLGRGPRADGTSSEPIGRVQVRLSMYNPYQNYLTSSATDFGLAEAWAAIGNLSASQPGMTFWAGNRYYRRHDMHIDDFFMYNMSGGGGGIEDIKTPLGKFALAWIGIGSQSGFSDIPQPDPQNTAGFSKSNLDFRLYDFKLPGGSGELGFDISKATSGKDEQGLTAPKATGVSFTFIHTSEKWAGENSLNKFYIQYGRGPAKTFTSGFETYGTAEGTFIRPDAPGSYRFRVAENLIFQYGDHFSISPVVLYQASEYKQYGGMQHWVSMGVRPVAHFNEYVSLAFEPFVDWVDDKNSHTSDYLFKMTVAPQVSLGRNFMSRPAIRAFFTYARWGDQFVGKVGGFDYANRRYGMTAGIQMETWW